MNAFWINNLEKGRINMNISILEIGAKRFGTNASSLRLLGGFDQNVYECKLHKNLIIIEFGYQKQFGLLTRRKDLKRLKREGEPSSLFLGYAVPRAC